MAINWLAAIGVLIAAPAAAQQKAPVSDAERAAVAQAQARGALIYAYDQAAWHGTDDMQTKLKNWQTMLGGYVVEGPANAPVLTFYDRAGRKALYVARFADNRLIDSRVTAASDAGDLSPLARRLIAARLAATAAIKADATARSCAAQPFNTVVLPPDRPGGSVSVYFLTPQTTVEAMPFGGHYAVDVDEAGHAGPVRRFTNTCLSVQVAPNLPQGSTAAMVTVSQLIGDTPTEIHVFSSISIRKPVLVITPRTKPARIWAVVGPRVRDPILAGR